MIITGKAIPRRTILRGLGASVALPLLDSMVPAFAAEPASVNRLAVMFSPNGMNMTHWTPTGEGTAWELSSTLQPLVPFRDRLLVLTGLDNGVGDALPGEGETAPHERAGGVFLTSTHPERQGHVDVSMDQLAARELGKATQLQSLELGLHSSELAGLCEKSWSCAYINTLSWRAPTTPVPVEYRPRAVFERLFGDSNSTDPAVRRARMQKDRSLLDSITEAAGRLMNSVGAGDRARLGEYLEGMRDIERRIQLAEEQASREIPTLERPVGAPETFEEYVMLMMDLQVLAFRTDMTRVSTFMLGPEQDNRTYPEIGVPEVHHALSHHQRDETKLAKLAQIDAYHMRLFRTYLEKLQSTRDGNGTLLDSSTILFGCSMSDGNQHLLQNLPIIVTGGANGKIKGGRHLRYPKGTPVSNLYVSLLDTVGVHVDAFGNSTGRLAL